WTIWRALDCVRSSLRSSRSPARQLPQRGSSNYCRRVRADIDKLLSGGRNRRIGAELRNLRSELRHGSGLLAGVARAPKCILAGDPYQLPPTVRSERAVAARLRFGGRAPTGRSPGFAGRVGWRRNDDEFPPLLLVDTAGCDLAELESDDSEMSKANTGEAAIVAEHVSALVTSGLAPSDIAVDQSNTFDLPFNSSSNSSPLRPAICKASKFAQWTVSKDAKKGGGYNLSSEIQSQRNCWLSVEHRRLNVAVTRARRHLCVIGDCDTVGRGDSVLAGFVQYLLTNAKSLTKRQQSLDKMQPESDKTASEI
uniref:AAA_12 domain-containing protein n=1 Tax=Macrostomum lignano TaxID=282301 RepID=A0A1I8FRU5_9PLAT